MTLWHKPAYTPDDRDEASLHRGQPAAAPGGRGQGEEAGVSEQHPIGFRPLAPGEIREETFRRVFENPRPSWARRLDGMMRDLETKGVNGVMLIPAGSETFLGEGVSEEHALEDREHGWTVELGGKP
ncbi:hypothetical protein E8E01_01065 [Methylorubrum populi]|uniref:hypothetical protein n=1 Tax=Methylorubrum populi TaxID=223967 RepID=UPI00115432A9|nr:hypothetical protein [Methylorubrum populi]QDI79121.1 hypothetical protein E8E01_01065 [Methylorubrum populi]